MGKPPPPKNPKNFAGHQNPKFAEHPPQKKIFFAVYKKLKFASFSQKFQNFAGSNSAMTTFFSKIFDFIKNFAFYSIFTLQFFKIFAGHPEKSLRDAGHPPPTWGGFGGGAHVGGRLKKEK